MEVGTPSTLGSSPIPRPRLPTPALPRTGAGDQGSRRQRNLPHCSAALTFGFSRRDRHWLRSAHVPDRVRLAPDRRGSVRRGGIYRTELSMSGEARSSLMTIVARLGDRSSVLSDRSGAERLPRAGRRTERPSAIGRFVGERPKEIEWAWRRSEGIHREALREPNSILNGQSHPSSEPVRVNWAGRSSRATSPGSSRSRCRMWGT